MSKNTGGPAFPRPNCGEHGMTLRDYFAAKAMQGMTGLLNPVYGVGSGHNAEMIEFIVRSSRIVADAMLKERDKWQQYYLHG